MSNLGTNASGKRLLAISAALLLSATIAGCANRGMTTGSISRDSGKPLAQMSAQELDGAADSLGKAFARNPKDRQTAIRYANVLQMNGRADQSLAVMRTLAIGYPKDRDVLAAYGKALAADGQLRPALDAIQRYPLPEQLAADQRHSSLCFFTPAAQPPQCGTLRHFQEEPCARAA